MQPDLPSAALRGSTVAVLSVPKTPIVVPQKTESSQQSQGVEVERGQGIANNRAKRSRDEDVQRGKRPNAGKDTVDHQVQKKRAGESDRSQKNGKEPAGRDSSAKDSARTSPSWLHEGFQVLITQSELINLVVEINKYAPIMSGLHLNDPRIGRFL